MDRRGMLAVGAIASMSAGSAAADVTPRALARVARAPQARCPSPSSQNVTDDTEPAAASAPDADEPPPFSLGLGVGAAWLRSRAQNVQHDLVDEGLRSDAIDASYGGGSSDASSGSDGLRIDGEGTWLGPPLPDSTYRDEHRAAYPTLSLTLDLQQPLVSLGALRLRLAERFSIAVAPGVSHDDPSLFAGFADVVLGAHSAGFPVQAGVGPTLGVLDAQDELFGWEEPVLVGVVGVVRVQLPGVPGTLDVVVRGTRLLAASAEAGSYRDAELALTVPL
jgi:hypothetical protein